MTNKELKRQSFLEATRRRKEARENFEKENPARAAYDRGEIGWNEYLRRSKTEDER